MRNRYSGLLAIVLTSSICANAQSIDGKVMENDSIPVPYATVSLLQASDSAYVAGVIGGEDGSFSFDTNSSGKIVKVSCIGYKTVFLPAAAHMTIHLLPSEQALQGVTVTASRPPDLPSRWSKDSLSHTYRGPCSVSWGWLPTCCSNCP